MRLMGSDMERLAGIHATTLGGMEYFEVPTGRCYLLRFEHRDELRKEAWYRVQIPLVARDHRTVTVMVTGWRTVGEVVGSFVLPLDELRCPLTLDPQAVTQGIGIALADLGRPTSST